MKDLTLQSSTVCCHALKRQDGITCSYTFVTFFYNNNSEATDNEMKIYVGKKKKHLNIKMF